MATLGSHIGGVSAEKSPKHLQNTCRQSKKQSESGAASTWCRRPTRTCHLEWTPVEPFESSAVNAKSPKTRSDFTSQMRVKENWSESRCVFFTFSRPFHFQVNLRVLESHQNYGRMALICVSDIILRHNSMTLPPPSCFQISCCGCVNLSRCC